MDLKFLGYQWRIHWLPLLLFICVFSLLMRLGFWQLERAKEKQLFLLKQQQHLLEKPVPIEQFLNDFSQSRYRPVLLQGRYDIKQQLLVDNQIYAGQLGAFVLTPFILDDNKGVVLVNRGWVAMDKARKKLPNIDLMTETQKISLTGIINEFPSVGLVLQGADEPSDSWPIVVQIVNIEKLRERFKYTFLPFQVQLKDDQANGYIRDWTINTQMPPEKHQAYAFQWFALATTLFFLILWISCKTHKHD